MKLKPKAVWPNIRIYSNTSIRWSFWCNKSKLRYPTKLFVLCLLTRQAKENCAKANGCWIEFHSFRPLQFVKLRKFRFFLHWDWTVSFLSWLFRLPRSYETKIVISFVPCFLSCDLVITELVWVTTRIVISIVTHLVQPVV
jgi:hypothetical protein